MQDTNLHLISPEIEFQKLPPFFQHGLSITDNAASADMLLIALLTSASSVLPRFYFRHGYPQHTYGANLMSLVIAPPASGKGIMNRANGLVDWADHTIPGNASVSAFLSELERLGGAAYLMETEADVMSKTLRTDGNDYSYILRQAWEGEPIRRARDGKQKQRITIEHPHLSVLLSGTLNQLKPLLHSRSNGLTSRMLCYLVTEIQGFDTRVFGQDPSTAPQQGEESYRLMREYLQALYEWQLEADHDCLFRLTDEQTRQLSDWFADEYNLLMGMLQMPVGFDSMLKRLAVTVMRIGMILNALRLPTGGEFPAEIVCTDDDFQTMLLIADTLVMHMVDLFALLPEEEGPSATKIVQPDRRAEAQQIRQQLLDLLPETFTTDEVRKAADAISLQFRTAERWLTEWIKEGAVKRLSKGHYRKMASL